MSTADPGGGSIDPTQVRISDADRSVALEALGEHFSSGRLDLDEYGTRTAQVTAAKTNGDLQALFIDLPSPGFGTLEMRPAGTPSTSPPTGGARAAVPGHPAVPHPAGTSRAQQIAAGLAGVAGLIAVVLYFLLQEVWQQAWLVFLLIPLAYGIGTAVWGPGWRDSARGRDDSS